MKRTYERISMLNPTVYVKIKSLQLKKCITLQKTRFFLIAYFTYLLFSDIVLNDSEASWVSSLSSLGFVTGGLVSGLFMRMFGRKYSSVFGLGLSYVIGYALIAFAPAKEYIYVGRFFGGICQVIFYLFSPSF